jgi:hypothetical protein
MILRIDQFLNMGRSATNVGGGWEGTLASLQADYRPWRDGARRK